VAYVTESAAPTSSPQSSGATSTAKRTGITIVIVLVSVVGGVALIWFVYRQIQTFRSRKADSRMQVCNTF
jgi:hypothetical protein